MINLLHGAARLSASILVLFGFLLGAGAHANGVIPIEIDVKPGKEPNSINTGSKQKIAVAVIGSAAFDVSTIDPLTAAFGPNGALETHGRGHVADVNADGFTDLVLHFAVADTGIECPDSDVTLMAELLDGTPVAGTDSISITGCDFVRAAPGDFCTQTQGGWGQQASTTGNIGDLRDAYFGSFFPSGLVIGDPDGPDADAFYAIKLTSSLAVETFLPTGGTPATLTQDFTDPTDNTISGALSGNLIAATLNIGFDANGIGRCTLTNSCSFPYAPGKLDSLVFGSCAPAALEGLTVGEVIEMANGAISGVSGYASLPELNAALVILNDEFVDCDSVVGCLLVPKD